jgi:glycosyltransferase involved in cell wall biosynthesis
MLQACVDKRVMSAQELVCQLPNTVTPSPGTIVAIPARDEEERIGACLEALLAQRDRCGRLLPPDALGVVLLLNNCSDRTAAIAKSRLVSGRTPFALVDVALPPSQANAGFARRLALDLAAAWLAPADHPRGVLLTTDADSRVPPQWLVRNWAALSGGSRAVAGRVTLDRNEEELLPRALIRRTARENAYEQALLALRACVDPVGHDPWPNHWTASGASYAVTLDAYRAIGGLPCPASGEDQALTDALLRHDVPIRHDPNIVVVTSARLEGRACGGVADTIRMRCEDPDTPADQKLEALPNALRRYLWRRRLRRWHAAGTLQKQPWHIPLGLPRDGVPRAAGSGFGAFWADVEAASPRLARTPLRPSQMPVHTAAARALLAAFGWPDVKGR